MLIVDDEALVRHALRIFLSHSERIKVVGEATNGAEAIESTIALNPDIVLMDIRMPIMDGIAATRAICLKVPSTKVMAVTTFTTRSQVTAALKAGATSYIVKNSEPELVIAAVIDLYEDRPNLSPEIIHELIVSISGRNAISSMKPALTDREQSVLELLARGQSNVEIAKALFVSEATVKTVMSSILRKWDLRDRTQVLIQAVRDGLVSIE